jgi:hypothetical protein
MSVNFAYYLKQINYKKILIISFDEYNKSIFSILENQKNKIRKIKNKINNNYLKNFELKNKNNKIIIFRKIIKINNNIDFFDGINFSTKMGKNNEEKIFKILEKNYQIILVDINKNCNKKIKKIFFTPNNKNIFLIEANLLGIKNAKKEIENNFFAYGITKEKINIIINKWNKNCIYEKIINDYFSEFKILGKINYNIYFNNSINKKYIGEKFNKKIINEFKKIIN